MRCPARLRFAFVIARVAVCLAALLVQATLLPLAHACHDHALSAERAGAARGGTGHVRHADTAAPEHNAATCPLCAALAHGRTGIVTAPLGAPAPQAALGEPPPTATVWSHRTAPIASRPRAPPALAA
jgi:hypothetical protein